MFIFVVSWGVELQNLSVLKAVYQEMEWHFAAGYVSYFMLGYFLHSWIISGRMQKMLYAGGIACLIATVVVTISGLHIKGEAWGIIHYFQPNIMIITAAMIVF